MNEHHEVMLNYVRKQFENYTIQDDYIFRHKLHHTERVIEWIKRISATEKCNRDVLLAAAIFHDVGYTVSAENHPQISSEICKDYLTQKKFGDKYIEKVCKIIANHGNKTLLSNTTEIDQLILIEADCLDESGAMSIIRDAMSEGHNPIQSYSKTLKRIKSHGGFGKNNPMITNTSRKIWADKQRLIKTFISSLEVDLGINKKT